MKIFDETLKNAILALDAKRSDEYDSLMRRSRRRKRSPTNRADSPTNEGDVMKCQKCDKVATFHITELTDSHPEELHLCDEHAYQYLHSGKRKNEENCCDKTDDEFAEIDEEDDEEDELDVLSLKELTEDLMAADFQPCPCCGLGFQEFRQTGRLGCANDYQTFREQLEPLLLGVHGATEHLGKRPTRCGKADFGALLVHLRNELSDAVETEDYERASVIRDKINDLVAKIA